MLQIFFSSFSVFCAQPTFFFFFWNFCEFSLSLSSFFFFPINPQSNHMSKVIVIGGGLAGLSAAHTILENGGSVLLLDKSAFLGGNSTKATSGINGKRCSLFLFSCEEISLFLRLFCVLRAPVNWIDFSLFSLFLSLSFQQRRAMMICASPRERSFLSLSFSLSLSLFSERKKESEIQYYIKKRAVPFSREKIRFLTEI